MFDGNRGFGLAAQRVPVTSATGAALRLLHWVALVLEAACSVVRWPVKILGEAAGWRRPRTLLAFNGWVSEAGMTRFGCRVLSNHLLGSPRQSDSTWRNLLGTLRRWDTRELPGVRVTAELRVDGTGGVRSHTRVTDAEGYAWFDLPAADQAAEPPPDAPRSAAATLRVEHRGHPLQAEAPLWPASPLQGLAAISDIDDTILHTGITSLLTAAKLTFLRNARTRAALPGAARLYEAFAQTGGSETPRPFFYVSSSAWNLHDLLSDFMRLNGFPSGPLLLRDLGVDRFKLLKSSGHVQKLERARLILRDFPSLRFVLLGDSGQADAHLYAELAVAYPHRIAAVVVRCVSAAGGPAAPPSVLHELERISGVGVPARLVTDSVEAAEFLHAHALLNAADLGSIAAATEADRQRQGPLAAAVRGAGSSNRLVPGRVVEAAGRLADRLEQSPRTDR